MSRAMSYTFSLLINMLLSRAARAEDNTSLQAETTISDRQNLFYSYEQNFPVLLAEDSKFSTSQYVSVARSHSACLYSLVFILPIPLIFLPFANFRGAECATVPPSFPAARQKTQTPLGRNIG